MMMEELKIEIGEQEAGRRLDAVVAAGAEVSRTRAAELVGAGAVTVDGRREAKAYRVCAGEVVEVLPLERPAPAGPLPEIPIVWEDEHLLVADKPAGTVVHGGPGLREHSLIDALAASGRPLAPRAGAERPGVVHRLDRDVSGLLIVAKTDAAHERLSRALARREIRREYLAGVVGVPEVDAGKIEAPIERNPRHRTRMMVGAGGRPAVTWFRVRERLDDDAAILEVRLETGRTHQIRTHFEAIGHPILGDRVYGRDPQLARRAGLNRPFLHAFRLALDHPATRERLELEQGLPGDLLAALEKLRGW